METVRIPRYKCGGASLISFKTIESPHEEEIIPLTAEDGGESKGVLYSKGGEKAVVCLMHPRADMSRHYAVPYLLDAGYAVFGQEGRWPGNDIACIHEMLLADVAAGLKYLRERCGYQSVVVLGNSGGGSLYAFYLAQASRRPPARLTTTAAGDAYDLNRITLPMADGIILLAAHLGEGKFLERAIDPSVTDEGDPLSCDPALDMYNSKNGFREPPTPSVYSGAFAKEYRAAQKARVARIDAIARAFVDEQNYFGAIVRGKESENATSERQAFIRRRALVGRYMEVPRTEANLAYTDNTLSVSKRDYGSLWSPRPDLFNYTEAGFGKYQTPRAWLSTWSGMSSRAALLENIQEVHLPTLVLNHTGDHAIYPEEAAAVYAQSPASDKEAASVDADHFGFSITSSTGAGGRDETMRIIVAWLRARYPSG